MGKSKSTATVLAFFGGAFGLHKFYLGETGKGIMYIFLSYMLLGLFRIPITVFLGIIDGIKLLGLTEAEFHDRYVYNTRTKRRKRRQQRYAQRDTRQPDKETSYRYENRRGKRKNPFKLSAKKKYEDFDLEEAIEDYEKALLLDPQDAEIHIDMAAGYSLLENKDKAYYHIKKAKELGWSKTGEILEKDDFAFIRIQKDFETFRASGYTAAETKTLDAPKEDLLQDDLLLCQLKKLKNMRERGLLSEKEFIQEKEKLFKK